MDAEGIFKIWLRFIIAVLIVSGLCLIIGIMKNIQLLIEMPILGVATVSFSTCIKLIIVEDE